jgi:hypothetical protein
LQRVQATHNEQLLHELTRAFWNAGAEVAALKSQLELCKTRAERAAADCSLEHQGMAQSTHQKVVKKLSTTHLTLLQASIFGLVTQSKYFCTSI